MASEFVFLVTVIKATVLPYTWLGSSWEFWQLSLGTSYWHDHQFRHSSGTINTCFNPICCSSSQVVISWSLRDRFHPTASSAKLAKLSYRHMKSRSDMSSDLLWFKNAKPSWVVDKLSCTTSIIVVWNVSSLISLRVCSCVYV